MKTKALEFFEVDKDYYTLHFRGKRKTSALSSVSFSVHQHEIFGLLGPNGAGKSTSIKLILGFAKITAGTIKIMGECIDNPSYRRGIGYLPELPFFHGHLTARETLTLSGKLSSVSSTLLKTRIPDLLEKMGLFHAIDNQVSTFSKGMKQRLGMANALIHDPPLLIFDEPMSGLDPLGRHQIKSLIMELKDQGKTIFFSSHILSDVEELCHSIGIIDKGKLLFSGTIDQLPADGANLEERFINIINT